MLVVGLKQSGGDVFTTWRPWGLDPFVISVPTGRLVIARIQCEFDEFASHWRLTDPGQTSVRRLHVGAFFRIFTFSLRIINNVFIFPGALQFAA